MSKLRGAMCEARGTNQERERLYAMREFETVMHDIRISCLVHRASSKKGDSV